MSERRTQNEIDADKFDAELFALFLRARLYGGDEKRKGRDMWKKISVELLIVRPKLRGMMHPDDRLPS